MNNRIYREALDDEAVESLDDESLDDESSAEFLGDLLGGLGGVIPGIIGGIGNIFKPPVRPPVRPVGPVAGGGGLNQFVIPTPRGSINVPLPEGVVTERELQQVTQSLKEAIDRNTARLNTTQNDIRDLSNKVGSVVVSTRREIGRALKEQRGALVKLRKDIRSQATTNMMMSLLTTQQIQKQLASHSHAADGETPVGSSTTAPAPLGADNTMMMLLPMMMMGSESGGGEDSSMMMAMVMAMSLK